MRAAFLLVPALAASLQGARPAWIEALPADAGKVYGLGVSPLSGPDADALRQASDNGRADVVTRLRVNVKADTRITTEYHETRDGSKSSATRTQDAQVGTQVQARAADLPGLTVLETFVDRPGGSCYALACLDLAVAQRELRNRLAAIEADRAAAPDGKGTRARLSRVGALRKAHDALARLEDQAALVGAGGGDAALRPDVQQARLDTERQLAAARSEVTFGFASGPGLALDPDVADAVRTAVLKEGLGWAAKDPVLTITARLRQGVSGGGGAGGPWWARQRLTDFVLCQGSLTLALVDRDGQEYESILLAAKGVGVDETQAANLLQADLRAKLGKAVAAWVKDLGSY